MTEEQKLNFKNLSKKFFLLYILLFLIGGIGSGSLFFIFANHIWEYVLGSLLIALPIILLIIYLIIIRIRKQKKSVETKAPVGTPFEITQVSPLAQDLIRKTIVKTKQKKEDPLSIFNKDEANLLIVNLDANTLKSTEEEVDGNHLSKEMESINVDKIYEQLNDIESLYKLDYEGIVELLEKIKQNLHLFNFDQLIPLLSRFMHDYINEFGLEVSHDSIMLIAEIFGKMQDKKVLDDLQFLYSWEPTLYELRFDRGYDPNYDSLSMFRLAALKAAMQLIDVGGKDIILGAVDDRHYIVYKTAAKACVEFKLKEAIPILLADRYNIFGTRDHEDKIFFDNILTQLDFPIDDKVTRFICDLIYDENFSYNLFELSDDITLPDFDEKLIIKLFKQYIEIDVLNRTFLGERDLLKEYDYILDTFKYYKLTEIVKEEDIVKLFPKDTEREKAINLLKLVKDKKIEEN